MGSMLRRCNHWDYRQRAIYMVTLTVAGREPLLGRLEGGEANPAIVPTPAGRLVSDCWRELPSRYPGVTLMECQVMPDHFHGIIFVREPQAKPLGSIVGAFKSHSSSLFKALQSGGWGASMPHAAWHLTADSRLGSRDKSVLCPAVCGRGDASMPPVALWSPGFQDTILFHKGQLANMRGYVLDNPRRLAVKRAHPDLFRIVREVPCCGTTVSALGSPFLLRAPVRRQVQCSRSIPPARLAELEAGLLESARHGAVLVSPCISPGEKQVARAALAGGFPLIVLLENGFPQYYKPPKNYFEACAAGRLLMLAPWPHHTEKRPITREQCLTLNAYAKEIAEGD